MKIMVLLLSMKRKNYIRKRYKFKENLKKKTQRTKTLRKEVETKSPCHIMC